MNDLAPIPLSEFERQKSKAPRFIVTNTNTIMATEFAPIRWVVPDYLPEGLSILAGRQKLGKTWLALDWAIAVATGGAAMGSVFCEVGDVLYIDLENGHRRIQGRINMLFSGERNRPDLSRLGWVNDAPDLNKAAEAASRGRAVSVAEADRFAASVLPVIQNLQRSGITSYRGIAQALNNRGVRTARGGQWQVSNVRNLLGRAGRSAPAGF